MASPVAGVPGLFISYECITEELEQQLLRAARSGDMQVKIAGRSFQQWLDSKTFPEYISKAWSGCVYGSGGGMPDVAERGLPS